MGSFSNDKIALFSFDVVGQLGQSLDGIVQGVSLRVVDINVNDAMNVERDVHVDDIGFLVGETVGVFTVCIGFDFLVAMVQVSLLQDDFAMRGNYVEVGYILFGVVRVSGADLERNGELVVLLQCFKETQLAIGTQQDVVCGDQLAENQSK